jgi:hypothetical protein
MLLLGAGERGLGAAPRIANNRAMEAFLAGTRVAPVIHSSGMVFVPVDESSE